MCNDFIEKKKYYLFLIYEHFFSNPALSIKTIKNSLIGYHLFHIVFPQFLQFHKSSNLTTPMKVLSTNKQKKHRIIFNRVVHSAIDILRSRKKQNHKCDIAYILSDCHLHAYYANQYRTTIECIQIA